MELSFNDESSKENTLRLKRIYQNMRVEEFSNVDLDFTNKLLEFYQDCMEF